MTLTYNVAKVLAVMSRSRGEHYGLGLIAATGIMSGNLYPIIARLEKFGLIKFCREDSNVHGAGWRPRRYFEITPAGADLAIEAVKLLQTEAATLDSILNG